MLIAKSVKKLREIYILITRCRERFYMAHKLSIIITNYLSHEDNLQEGVCLFADVKCPRKMLTI